MKLISFENFAFCYNGGQANAIENINLSVNEGEILLICGRCASGKSTLLRCVKENITPVGNKSGQVISNLASSEISVVFAVPDTQLVGSTVLDDLAFYMENLGIEEESMRRRLAEVVGFFGIEELIHRNPEKLSGGQKQLVVLSAAMMTYPRLLLLDEPTSQLDPIAAKDFLDTLKRLNEELGVTIIMTEHRLDDCIGIADRLAVMEDGKIIAEGETREVLKQIAKEGETELFVPELPRASLLLSQSKQICLTQKEWKKNAPQIEKCQLKVDSIPPQKTTSPQNLVAINNLFFAYQQSADYILKNLFLKIAKGERICLVGGNGSGKTTLLKIVSGILKPLHGSIKRNAAKICYLPQDISSYFRFETVREEILFDLSPQMLDSPLLGELGLANRLERHPLDLSGGEGVKLALFCMLGKNPDLIVLDEPTKGLDPYAKRLLVNWLQQTDAAVLCATHDLPFAARLGTTCAMIFDGAITFSAPTREFISGNQYYTTAVSQAVRGGCKDAVIFEDVMKICR